MHTVLVQSSGRPVIFCRTLERGIAGLAVINGEDPTTRFSGGTAGLNTASKGVRLFDGTVRLSRPRPVSRANYTPPSPLADGKISLAS